MMAAVDIDAECRAFTRYLVDSDPDDYVSARYADALDRLGAAVEPQTRFDRLLLGLARKQRVLTRAVDVYTRFFLRGSAVRRRLVTLLAIIESRAVAAQLLEQPDHGGLAGFIVGMAWRSVVLAALLLVASIILLPLQLLTGGRGDA